MEIQKIKDAIVKTYGYTEADFEKVRKEKEDVLKEFTKSEEDLQKAVANAVFAHWKKILMSPNKVYEGIVISMADPTDFGAKKEYESIREQWRQADVTIRKGMIDKGYVDEEGNPCWCVENTKNKIKVFDKDGKMKSSVERLIKPERELQRQGIGVFGEYRDGVETTFYRANITIRGEKINNKVPKNVPCRVRMNGKLDEEKKLLYLTSASVTEFLPTQDTEQKYDDVLNLVNKYFADLVIDFDGDTKKLNNISEMRQVIIVNAIPLRVSPTSGKSNVVDIGSQDLTLENTTDGVITCWVPKSEKLPAEAFGKVLVIGRPSVNEEKITINVSSIMSSFEMPTHQKIEPKPIVPVADNEAIFSDEGSEPNALLE
jgi:hypothetical protein